MLATLLVDPVSRINSNIEIAELKRFGIDIVSDLKEMLNQDYDGHPVIVLDGFVQNETGMSELILFQKMVNLNYIFISDNEVLLRQMSRYARTYPFSTEQVGYNLLLSAINNDSEACEPFMREPVDKFTALARVLLDNAGAVDPAMRNMASYLLNLTADNKRLHYELTQLKHQYDIVHGMNENKAGQLKHLTDTVDDILRQTIAVNDSLSKYSFLCQKDVYKKISLTEFKNRPHIVYFKEYGDFLHLDTFVFTIAEVLKRQFDSPTKVLWILDKNNPLRLKFVPSYYSIFAEGVYTRPALQISDYMCTTSGYDGLIQTICENQTGVDYLIIVDCKLVDDVVIPISEILKFDLCRSISKMQKFGLLDSRTIVNNEEDRELSWNHILDYGQLDSEDRFLYMSNRPVVNAVINVMRREFHVE